MINALEAAKNVITFEIERHKKIEKEIAPIIDSMSTSIEFHSRNGFTSLEFTPYGRSQYDTEIDKQIASQIFETVFKENGYTIIRNDISQNLLKIQW